MNLVPVLIKSYFVVRFEGTSPDVEESIRQYYTSSPRAPVARGLRGSTLDLASVLHVERVNGDPDNKHKTAEGEEKIRKKRRMSGILWFPDLMFCVFLSLFAGYL